MNKSLNLLLLQNIETKIEQATTRQAQINAALGDKNSVLAAESGLNASNQELHQAEHQLKEIEAKIQAARIKVQQSESSLYGGKISNPKELQDLQTEIAMIKKTISALEEEQFTAMLIVEENLHVKDGRSEDLQHARTQKESDDSRLRAEYQNLEKDIASFLVERDASSRTIDPATMSLYQKVKSTHKGIAVSQVVDNACDKCGAEITQEEWQKARISTELCFCSTCGRILYAK